MQPILFKQDFHTFNIEYHSETWHARSFCSIYMCHNHHLFYMFFYVYINVYSCYIDIHIKYYLYSLTFISSKFNCVYIMSTVCMYVLVLKTIICQERNYPKHRTYLYIHTLKTTFHVDGQIE